MCDYSLMSLPNRLAVCGEELVVHRFDFGAVGLAPAAEVGSCHTPPADSDSKLTFFQKLTKNFCRPAPSPCTAVCIPPGARLLLRDIPKHIQRSVGLCVSAQIVTFTEISAVGFRDAIRFANGRELLLQNLSEGQRVTVLSLSIDDEINEQRVGSLTLKALLRESSPESHLRKHSP